ncbi:polyadenylate-binding protein-interacting protein 12 [Lactuca sativa]|uniref:polyadenylate-binding protein-interacting protein 12 n=1 Tax=Lactuca sativa TaxID=4236 RepID=UPI000CD9BDE4|nr:polyadenylate-binding protein-interacting protein 12 [Lactuca sativa]XP_023771727.1 polyadenylate-binding protein-interacting protein 12 [Lactuca sativa]XP_023771728.1 polyadenylate-binding protein-interacting protein 12 [Lactuca sativa]
MAVVENAHSINVVASDVDQSTKSSYTTNNNNRNPVSTMSYRSNDYHHHHHQQQQQLQKVTPLQPPSNTNGNGYVGDDDGGDGFKKEMSDLEEMLSKLNPMAEEFVPHQRLQLLPSSPAQFGYAAVNNFLVHTNTAAFANGTPTTTRRKGNFSGKRRINSRTSMAQRDDVIKRTVYVSDIDQQVTEEQLAALFVNCGQVVDCRVCGDPNSVLHFAFIEFTDEEGARNALSLGGTMLGYYPVRVLPSKTAIAPVNPTFLPQSEDEREMCARTIYCTNIDKKVTQADVKLFFETLCGEVYRLRLLGDYNHSTRIAFVEFVMAESAIAALNCSGAVLGSLPIRVSPSKTPVRPRAPRSTMH